MTLANALLEHEFKKEVYSTAHLFTLAFPNHTYYWTSFEKNIFYSGRWYESKGIRFAQIASSMATRADSIELEIDNIDKKISGLVLGQELRGSAVTISLVSLNRSLEVTGAIDKFFYGFWDEVSVNQSVAKVKVYNHLIKWKTNTPRRIHGGTCSWRFKEGPHVVVGSDNNSYTCILNHYADNNNRPVSGNNSNNAWTAGGNNAETWVAQRRYAVGTCRYSGNNTWCDQSWDRCVALNNTLNFGGFRWLPYILDKDIWWGRSQYRWPRGH